jgi:sugar/nucleoside kinase (ribokinase family)
VLARVDVLKISEEELTFLTGLTIWSRARAGFFDPGAAALLLITRAPKARTARPAKPRPAILPSMSRPLTRPVPATRLQAPFCIGCLSAAQSPAA